MGIHDFWMFVVAGFLHNVTPGPDMALVIARSARQGTRAGIAAALGVGAGAFVHIVAAAVGVSAILFASAFAFALLKFAGAAYLVWLGARMILATRRGAPAAQDAAAPAPASLRSVFWQGALTNALNPKVAIFFLAFLPQFVDSDAPSKMLALLTLGLVFNLVGTAWNVGVACFAGRLAQTRGARGAGAWLERGIGALFVGLGAKLALAER